VLHENHHAHVACPEHTAFQVPANPPNSTGLSLPQFQCGPSHKSHDSAVVLAADQEEVCRDASLKHPWGIFLMGSIRLPTAIPEQVSF
jgi:hypothetical protein